MLARPVAVNLRQARTCMVTIANQLKHGLHPPIAAVAVAALYRQIGRYPHQAGVAKAEHVRAFDHKHRNAAGEIGVNQGVGQRLTKGFMHRRVFHTLAFQQLERHFQVGGQLLIDLAEKVIHIA